MMDLYLYLVVSACCLDCIPLGHPDNAYMYVILWALQLLHAPCFCQCLSPRCRQGKSQCQLLSIVVLQCAKVCVSVSLFLYTRSCTAPSR
jgi:hypothetical protein